MNIFEGFEQETPEQTASKLGIRKESLVEETKEELLDITKIDYILSKEDFKNELNWQGVSNINQLKVGMRVRKTTNHEFYGQELILLIDEEEGEVRILNIDDNRTLIYTLDELVEYFEFYKSDSEIISVFFNKVTNINNLRTGTLVCEEPDEEISAIVKIEETDVLGKKAISMKLSNNSNIVIEHNTLENWYIVNINYPTPVTNEPYTYNEDFENNIKNIRVGMRVKYRGQIYYVQQSNSETKEVLLNTQPYGKADQSDSFFVHEDTFHEASLIEEELDFERGHKWTKIGNILNEYNEYLENILYPTMILFYIDGIGSFQTTICEFAGITSIGKYVVEINGTKHSFDKKEFLSSFAIHKNTTVNYIDYLNENDATIGFLDLKPSEIQDDNLWEDWNNIETFKIKKGFRIRKKDTVIGMCAGVVSGPNGEMFEVHYVDERDRGLFYLPVDHEFQVLKSDLIPMIYDKETQKDDSLWGKISDIGQLQDGTRLRALNGFGEWIPALVKTTNEQTIKVKTHAGHEETWTLEEFLIRYEVYKEDLLYE